MIDLNKRFEEYVKVVYQGQQLPPKQLIEVRQAFWAGCIEVQNAYSSAISYECEDKCVEELQDLADQVENGRKSMLMSDAIPV